MRHTSPKWMNGLSSALTTSTSSRARRSAAALANLIGKALEPLDKGVGEILVLLSLQ